MSKKESLIRNEALSVPTRKIPGLKKKKNQKTAVHSLRALSLKK